MTGNITGRHGFREWMRQVNYEVMALAGCSVYDLADMPFRDWHESDMDPREAAIYALEDEGVDIDWLLDGESGDDW